MDTSLSQVVMFTGEDVKNLTDMVHSVVRSALSESSAFSTPPYYNTYKQNMTGLTLKMDDIVTYYGGYETYDGSILYNPVSISGALVTGELRGYWIGTGKISVSLLDEIQPHELLQICRL